MGLLLFSAGGLGFEFYVLVAGWRHALRSEWSFITSTPINSLTESTHPVHAGNIGLMRFDVPSLDPTVVPFCLIKDFFSLGFA